MCPFSKIAKSGKSLHPTLHPLYITHLSTSLIDPYGLHHFVPSAFQILPLCNTISSVYLTTAVSISVYIILKRWKKLKGSISNNSDFFRHRRRIKTEEKAKVVASVWGEEFIQFIATLAVLHWMI